MIRTRLGGVESFVVFKKDLGRFNKLLNKHSDNICRDIVKDLRNTARLLAPQRGKYGSITATGTLRESIRQYRLKNGVWRLYVSARSSTGFPYPLAQETGTGERVGKPASWTLPNGTTVFLSPGLMVFKDNRTGKWVAKHRVAGIGQKAIGRRTLHYIRRAFRETLSRWEEATDSEFRKMFSPLKG